MFLSDRQPLSKGFLLTSTDTVFLSEDSAAPASKYEYISLPLSFPGQVIKLYQLPEFRFVLICIAGEYYAP